MLASCWESVLEENLISGNYYLTLKNRCDYMHLSNRVQPGDFLNVKKTRNLVSVVGLGD